MRRKAAWVAVIAGCALAGCVARPAPPLAASRADVRLTAIGTAKMLPDGTIELHLYRTADGQEALMFQTLHPGDALYEEVIRHVDGLKPGETKPVPPWPDDPKP